jgi:plastocyanin
MFNTAAKLYFAMAAVAFGLAVGYEIVTGDESGMALLLGIGAAATLAGLVVTGSGLRDRAPRYALVEQRVGAGAPPLETITVDRSLQSKPSAWPLLTALTAGVVGVGLAVGAFLVVIGVSAGALVTGGWLAQCWREDPSFTPRIRARVTNALIVPLGAPLLALVLVAVIVISVSRVLLAVPKDASIAIAFALAALLLIGFFVLASRPRPGRATMVFLSGFAVVAVVTAGSVSAANGYRTFEKHETGPGPITVVAKGIKYQQATISVTQGQIAQITFDNLDSGTYHDIAVYSQAQGGTPYWAGEPVQGVKRITYRHSFTMAPGTYVFRCDFHPTAMIGAFTVTAPGGGK